MVIILMKASPRREKVKEELIAYNRNRIIQGQLKPVALDLRLTSNPFLKEQEKYHFLIFQLTQYNKRVQTNQITDHYQTLFYQKLHSVICQIAFIDSKQNQIGRLNDTLQWFRVQEKLLQQRKNQGQIRYQVKKEEKIEIVGERSEQAKSDIHHVDSQIPTNEIKHIMKPYKKGNRTLHEEVQSPKKRLEDYKRKILNFEPFTEPKDLKVPPKILYPKIPKFDPKYDDIESHHEGEAVQKIIEGDEIKVQEDIPQEGLQEENKPPQEEEKPPEQDLGGFGEQPAEPEDQDPVEEEGEDKLAPKVKSFTIEFADIKRKQFKGPYMFYKGDEIEADRRMELKYFQIANKKLNRQKQEAQQINFIEEWAASKSKVERERAKRLENKNFHSAFKLSHEEALNPETLSEKDEAKYGFASNMKTKGKHCEVSLSDYHLPQIGDKNVERSMRSDRLKSLKKKFGKLLNLQDYEEREAIPTSICQFSARKRSFSDFLRDNSKDKERSLQLDEIVRIKQKLSRSKIDVSMKSLFSGLGLPDDDPNPPDSIFPAKDLPSNPFFVEVKKKKKKK